MVPTAAPPPPHSWCPHSRPDGTVLRGGPRHACSVMPKRFEVLKQLLSVTLATPRKPGVELLMQQWCGRKQSPRWRSGCGGRGFHRRAAAEAHDGQRFVFILDPFFYNTCGRSFECFPRTIGFVCFHIFCRTLAWFSVAAFRFSTRKEAFAVLERVPPAVLCVVGFAAVLLSLGDSPE